MRFPILRFGEDTTPITKWELLFAPLVIPLFFLGFFALVVLSVPYYAIFPENHARQYDFGTDREKRVAQRWRQFVRRQPLGKRWWRRFRARRGRRHALRLGIRSIPPTPPKPKQPRSLHDRLGELAGEFLILFWVTVVCVAPFVLLFYLIRWLVAA